MRTLAIGLLGIVLVHGAAFAQTPQEQQKILGTFKQSVAELTVLDACTDPLPAIFTLPVATVFRQMIARALDEQPHVSHLVGAGTWLPRGHHPAVFEPFPAAELHPFPALLARTLPPLPAALEYRLIGNDLVVREVSGNVIVAVLRDAVGGVATAQR